MLEQVDCAVDVDNPAEALLNETGLFEVISPYGLSFEVCCRRGSRMSVREIPSSTPRPMTSVSSTTWRIRRLVNTPRV